MPELKRPARQAGFSLVELAIVLLALGLLLGGLIYPLGAQVEQARLRETERMLAEIREALIGFAIIHGRLPCPATEVDPHNAAYGVEDASCSAPATAEGYLPWKTLGVAELDAWGSRRLAAADPFAGNWRYRVDRNFSAGAPFALSTPFADQLVITDHSGNNVSTTAERPVAIVFSAGPNRNPDGKNARFDAAYEAGERAPDFDDSLIWIARPQLFARMVAAARLP